MSDLPLFNFAWFRDFDQALNNLSDLAMDENWDYQNTKTNTDYPIQFNYLHHTFQKLQDVDKVFKNDDSTVFNTGLATENQEEIFAFFEENRMPTTDINWYFKGFRKGSDRDLMQFDKLPKIANYFQEPEDLIYDTRLDLRVNIDHIIGDNRDRFPDEFGTFDKYQLGVIVNGSIEEAKKRIKRNYKTAIPQYFNGKIQLLLPLCLTSKESADLALVVEKDNNIYRAATCLTLDMAINNARLLAKPDDEWLKP